jgi:hypothetical protein
MDDDSNNGMRLSTLVLIVALAFFYNAEIFLLDTPSRTSYQIMSLFGTMAAGAVVIFTVFSNFASYLIFPFWGLAYLLAAPHFTGGYTLHIMFSEINLIHAAMVAGVATLTNWYVTKLDGYLQNDYQAVDYAAAPPLLEDGLSLLIA